MAHEVDLLLSCGCVTYERIEAVIYLPDKGEQRYCPKHRISVTITRVGSPYHVDEKENQKK